MDDQLMVVCGGKVYPSEYGTSYFATKLEKDIIFGSIFTAAPELIVSTNTAFKKIQQSTALAGVQKTSPNTQVGNIVNGLKQAGVWDVEGLEALAQSKGNDGAAAVAKIASFILQRFSQGTQMLFGRNSRTRLMATIIAWPADTSLVSCCVTMSTVSLAGTKEIIIRGR